MFIAIEGIDGCGKTTISSLLKDHIESLGRRVVRTSDLLGTPLGEQVRAVLTSGSYPICAESEMMLLTAARIQHVNDVIIPELKRGSVVISDRFYGSTWAYQASQLGFSFDHFYTLAVAPLGIRPDKTIYLKMDANLDRARSRGRLDRIESRGLSYFEAVVQGFNSISKQEGFIEVDASLSVYGVFNQVKKALQLTPQEPLAHESEGDTCYAQVRDAEYSA